MTSWIFDKGSASRYKKGAPMVEKLFGAKGSLIKEAIQNAVDQIVDSDLPDPGTIEIVIHELTGDIKARFLKKMQWDDLSKHIYGASHKKERQWQVHMSKWHAAIVDPDKPLRLLTFSDFGPKGLVGPSDFDEDSDFIRLCKSEHNTNVSNQNRSGSHGLGKAVFWANSGVNTVLFGSLAKQNPADKVATMRIFGQSLLSGHQVDDRRYEQTGFFGEEELDGDELPFCVSIWDDQRLAEDLFIGRNAATAASGTTVMVVDYQPTGNKENRESSAEELITNLRRDVEKWFWPALASWEGARPIVSVKLKYVRDLVTQFTEDATPDSYSKFKDSLENAPTCLALASSGDLASDHDIAVDVLKIKGDSGTPAQGKISVNLVALAVGTLPPELRNKVALLRNRTMVIAYEDIKPSLADGIEACGVVATGYAHGRDESDRWVHDFLRACEPPAHDNWKYDDDIYLIHGAMNRRDNLITAYKNGIKKLCVPDIDTDGRLVSALASMLRFHGKGSLKMNKKVYLSETALISTDIQKKIIKLRFKLNFKKSGSDPWARRLKFKVKGTPDYFSVEDYNDLSGKCRSWMVTGDGLALTTQNSDFVDGEVFLLAPGFIQGKDMTNLAVDIIIVDDQKEGG